VALDRALREVSALDADTRLQRRYEKFRKMGAVGLENRAAEPAAADAPER
jgi:hypothetical protein